MFQAIISLLFLLGSFQGTIAAYNQRALENDLEVLNYALSLEHLDSAFFTEMQNRFTIQNFTDANYSPTVYHYMNVIASQEAAHAAAITAAITALNGDVAPICTYDFSVVTNITTYLLTAQLLENVGTKAYAGALNRLTLAGLQQAAATIATVEARHASFINNVLSMTPFPDAFNPTFTPDQTIAVASQLIVACPNNFTIPTPNIRPYGLAANQTSSINSPTINYTQAEIDNDVATLQFALTLEHLEKNFYVMHQNQFTEQNFIDYGLNATDYMYFNMIRDHEIAHVQFLNDSLASAGITPVTACTYNFSAVVDVASYLAYAKIFENLGVSAYDGAANSITDIYYQQAAATIAEIEARHAAYLNGVAPNASSPFPQSADTALTPAQVAELVQPFVVDCPQFENLVVPTVAPLPNNLNGIIAPDGSIIPSGVAGDPQFVGLRGQSYQVHGLDGEVYNLVSTRNLQVNSRFVYLDSGKCKKDVNGYKPMACWSHPGSYLGEIGIQLVINDQLHKLLLVSGPIDTGFASVVLDGKAMKVGDETKFGEDAEFLSVSYSHSHYITVDTRLFSFGFDNSHMFINQRVRTNVGYDGLEAENSHGLFGQSWKGGIRQGPLRKIKEIEGDVDEYTIADGNLFGSDFLYNSFSS